VTDRLRREFGLFDATMLVAGSVIGVGIFTTTGLVAAAVPHPGWLLFAWLFGGVLSGAGALANAELAASLPHAGGDYVYLREAFHPGVGFFAGWMTFFVVYCGTAATLAAGLMEYLGVFLPAFGPENAWVRAGPLALGPGALVALAAIWGCTAICIAGVREGARTQDLLTLAKILAILALCVLGPLFGSGEVRNLVTPFEPSGAGSGAAPALLPALGVALVPVMFTYLGWNAPVYVGSEVRDPGKTFPRALVVGTALCTGVYLLLNAVYLYAVPVGGMFEIDPGGDRSGIVRIAELAATALLGTAGGRLVSGLVLVSIVGCLNATVLVGARIVYAMAIDRSMPGILGAVHPTRGTPHVALLAQGGVTSALLLTGTFEALLTTTTFAIIFLMVLDGLALYALRWRRPDLPRPYRTWGYPIVPGLFVLASLWLLVNTLIELPVESLIGLAISATALPAYWYQRRTR
jgi:APA family basic amino acid/polyamine antiporter